MTTKQMSTIVKRFAKMSEKLEKHMQPHIYDDGSNKWLQMMSPYHLVNVKYNYDLDLPYDDNGLWKYVQRYDKEIEIPTEKEVKEHMKEWNIKANYPVRDDNSSWVLIYELPSGHAVNVKYLYTILQVLGKCKAKVLESSGALSTIYFENDNGEYALLIPIRKKVSTTCANIISKQQYRKTTLGKLHNGDEFLLCGQWGEVIGKTDNGEVKYETTEDQYHQVWDDNLNKYVMQKLSCVKTMTAEETTTVYVKGE